MKWAGSSLPAWAAAALLILPLACVAAQDRLLLGGDAGELPSLPGEERAEQADAIHVDPESIALSDRGLDGMVGVSLDGYRDVIPSISVEKGWLVSSRLAVGGAYTFRSNASELLLNAVYATRPDVRILFSVSQLRIDDAAFSQDGKARTVLQTSYLSGIRKQWGKSRILPEASLTVFTSTAADSSRQDRALDGLEMGTLAGYMMRLAARPTYRSRLELSYQAQSTVYDGARTSDWRDSQASGSLDFSHTFDDCSRIRGRYTGGHGLGKTDLRYERGAFRLGFLQVRSDDYNDSSIQFGYSLPLGGGRQPDSSCDAGPSTPSPFRAIVDAATSRSPYLPSEPLTRSAAAPEAPG